LVRVFSLDPEYAVFGWDRAEMDVTDTIDTELKIQVVSPDVISNAVAYNAVDACEESDEEYAKAMLLNADVPKFLASLAKDLNSLFVHYSTDYVFGGNEIGNDAIGFDESIEPIPVCRYAVSKREGEKNVQAIGWKYYIIRLSKLFGKPALSEAGKKSFFEVMLSVGKSKDEVSVVDDEKSCFTYAPDLSQASKALIESSDAYGIYHLINEFPVTWYEGVLELYTQAGLQTKIVPVTSDAFQRPAKRPTFSVLRNTKRPLLRPYQEALKEFLEQSQ
jgi:dTDP-4-dehydrorhamnose reductase